MRIWDISVGRLCNQHLLGEHNELHCIFNTIVKGRKAWSHHPETKRWIGKLGALYLRHEEQIKEMVKRGIVHRSPLDITKICGNTVQDKIICNLDDQVRILVERSKVYKRCRCGEFLFKTS